MKTINPMQTKGFTLIELLIVISVLGILVSLILPRFGDVREDANNKVCVANLRGLASAMAIYETRQNIDTSFWGSAPYTVSNLVTWGYLATEPYCPYETGTTKTSYTLAGAINSADLARCPHGPTSLPPGDNTHPNHKWPQ